MRLGTPNFNGNKLTEAREARGLTLTSLAELLGISKQAVSQFEKGNHTPSPPLLDLLAQKLNVERSFFLVSDEPEDLNNLFFRSLSSATLRERIKAKRRYSWFKQIVALHSQYFELLEVRMPEFDLPADISKISDSRIEEVANECRRFWRMGDNPISDLTLLLENNGAIASRIGMDTDDLDAFSEWSLSDERPYILSGTDKNSAVRSRFNVAHELGHQILHRHLSKDKFNLKWHRKIEDQANLFASCFLLPARTFTSDMYAPTLDAFLMLKEKWKVSVASMIMRSCQLGIIDEDYRKRLLINKNRRWGARFEPLDDKLQPEQPKFIRRCFDILLENKVVSKEDILHSLKFSYRDIEDLCGLPERYFQKLPANNVEPKLRSNVYQLGSHR